MARKRKDSGIFGGFDAFSTGRKGRKSKGMLSGSLFGGKRRKKEKSLFSGDLFKPSKGRKKDKGLFSGDLFSGGKGKKGDWGLSSIISGPNSFGSLVYSLIGSFFMGSGMANVDEFQPTFESMRSFLKAHGMSPYNKQHILYYMMHFDSHHEARDMVDEIASMGTSLSGANRMSDKASWAYENWKAYKGNRDFNDMAWQVKTGEKTVEEVQGILGTYYRQSRGVLYYLQDLAGKDVLASPAGAIQDIQDEE